MARKKISDKICITFYKKIQSNALKRKLEFNLSIDELWQLFLDQDMKCALTGVNINIVNATISHNYHLNTASLDRIDSKKGYTKNNIRWIHKAINHLRSDIGDEDFIYLCHLIVNKFPKCKPINIDEINVAKKRSIGFETINKMKNSNPNKKPINQYDLQGNFIQEWPSINSARDYYQYKTEMGIISSCKGRQKSSDGFIWKYKNKIC